MKKTTNIFVISMIAIMASWGAHAEVAAVTYVEDVVASKADKADVYTKAEIDEMIPDGSQVQADWDATSGMSAIKNKPTLSAVATSGSYNDLADTPTIPDAYTLPVAKDEALGGVKSGGDITVANDGTVTVNSATSALSASRATRDSSGNIITVTYMTKTDLQNLESTAVTHTANTAVGDATHPIYVAADGVATKIDKVAAAETADTATTATSATTAASATKATQDGSGNVITTTYATKAELGDKQATLTSNNIKGTGSVSVTVSNGIITVDGTDTDTKYTLPAATAGALGGVKSGGNITVASDGQVTVNSATTATTAASATTAESATKATQDGSGNVITTTYATKTELGDKQNSSTAVTHTANTAAGDTTHPVYVTAAGVATKIDKVAAASAADTATTATNAKKICSGSSCASYVDIWVE